MRRHCQLPSRSIIHSDPVTTDAQAVIIQIPELDSVPGEHDFELLQF
jgi:hypothetical protein